MRRAVLVLLLAACSGGTDLAPGGENPPPFTPPASPPTIPPATSPAGEPIVTPADPSPAPSRPSDAVARENALPGTSAWRIRKAANRGEIEGYALASSAAAGDPVPIAVSLSTPGSYSWIAYRLGWYGGARGREVARGGPLAGGPQPPCPPQPGTGLVACRWEAGFELRTGTDWPSGAYLVKLVRADGFERFVPLVVRAAHASEVRMVIPTANWQAYNTWGGTSLYDDPGGVTGRGRAVQVSFDRPYVRDFGAGHLLRDDLSALAWLEALGVDVEYLTVEDVDRDPAAFAGARVVVVSAHDEYWPAAYRSRLDAAVAAGTSLLNLGANNGYWQIRLAPSADLRDRRIVVCWKGDAAAFDPVGPSSPLLTTLFRNAPVSRPENALFGVQFDGSWSVSGFPLVVAAPGHWALAGTGLAAGDVIPLATGEEVDDVVDNGASPAGLEVLGTSQLLALQGGVGRGRMVIRRQGAAWIFSSGGIGFAATLSNESRADARAQRLAANVLFRMLDRPLPAALPSIGAARPSPAADGFAASVTTVAGVPGSLGTQDGARGVGRMTAPVAVAVLPGGALAVADTEAGSVRRIDAAGRLTTLATGMIQPLGIAADAAGNVYVADGREAVIRRIAPGGRPEVIAGAAWESASVDGPGAVARFAAPSGMAVAGTSLYVADVGASTVRRVDLADPQWRVSTVVASGIYRPTAVAAAPDGTLYVAETGNRRVVAVRGGAIEIVAGGAEGFRDGPAAQAELLPQLGIAVLPDGSVAVADPGNYRVRRIAAGVVTTLAGSGRPGTRDGPGAEADLVLPAGLAVAADGTLYVAEAGNGAVRAIRR